MNLCIKVVVILVFIVATGISVKNNDIQGVIAILGLLVACLSLPWFNITVEREKNRQEFLLNRQMDEARNLLQQLYFLRELSSQAISLLNDAHKTEKNFSLFKQKMDQIQQIIDTLSQNLDYYYVLFPKKFLEIFREYYRSFKDLWAKRNEYSSPEGKNTLVSALRKLDQQSIKICEYFKEAYYNDK